MRNDVLSGLALTARRWGLSLLLTRGLAAWMQAWAAMDRAASPDVPPAALPLATHNDLSGSPRRADSGSDDESVTPSSLPTVSLPAQFQKEIASLVVDLILKRPPIPA